MNHNHLNLLSWPFRRNQLVRHRLKQWLVIWTIALMGSSYYVWSHSVNSTALDIQISRVQEAYKPVQQLQATVAQLDARIQELKDRESMLLALDDEQPVVRLVGVLSRAANSTGGQVSIERMRFSNDPSAEVRVLTLEGVAVDNGAVAAFVQELRESNAFERVELKSTGSKRVNEKMARSYNLECVL